MIELFGQFYPWTRDALKEGITDRLLSGSELTINYREKKAWIDKYGNNPLEINLDLAEMVIALGLVGADTGNIETTERHFNCANR